jgi:hypothetical protein
MQIRANSNTIQIIQPESSYRTLSGLTRLCPTLQTLFGLASNSNRFHRELLSDIVWLNRTLSNPARTLFGIQIWAERLDYWERSINIPPPPTSLPLWPLRSPGAKAHFLHLQRPRTLFPRYFTPSSWSRDWVKKGFEFLVWFTSSRSSRQLNLHPPCLLLLELCS